MTNQRGPDRPLELFLDEGPEVLPDRVVDAVREDIHRMRQRATTGPWRTPSMHRFTGFGLAAAAVVAAIVVSATALSRPGPWLGLGGPTPSEEPPVDLGVFEPVGGRIVYGDGQGIWGVDPAAPADPATRVQLTSEVGVPLGWSRDGTGLLIVRQTPGLPTGFNGEAHLFVLHADGSETQITERPMGIAGATISPDGSRVVFAAAAGDTDSALYAADVDGGPVEQLLGPGEHMIQQPTFSPDGTLIAYTSGGGDHSNGVWLVDADGSDARPIVPNESNEWPGHVRGLAWSPDGGRIALGLGGSIYTFATDGTQSMRVAGSSPSCTEADPCTRVDMLREVAWPHWSADGSQIAFTAGCLEGAGAADRDGCMLAIADADGSNVREFGYGASGPWHPGTPVKGTGG